jgi:hypothetical protein
MLVQANRVLVAVDNDVGRPTLVENLRADGYERLVATTLRHAQSRLSDHVDAAHLTIIAPPGCEQQRPSTAASLPVCADSRRQPTPAPTRSDVSSADTPKTSSGHQRPIL